MRASWGCRTPDRRSSPGRPRSTRRFTSRRSCGATSCGARGSPSPKAGSDLASLRTRAVVDGDELVVTGQKIWTSFADVADYQELLVRTNTEVPKHKGITWVICDMRSPGIDVRPIKTMEGGTDFCEVFYDGVRIPLANVVGGIDNGWSVAMSTLSFERGTAFTVDQVQLSSTVERLIEIARQRGLLDDDEIARAFSQARADVAALRALTYVGISRNLRAPVPGPEGSIIKLHWADLSKRHRAAGGRDRRVPIAGAHRRRRRPLGRPLPGLVRELDRRWHLRDPTQHHRRASAGVAPLMDLLPSSEQEEIISSAAQFLAATVPIPRTRQLIDHPSNVDAKAWTSAAELGWFALGLPEDFAGVGCGLADETLVFREIGRALASGPFLSTTLAGAGGRLRG